MSAVIETFLVCDGFGCGKTFGVDNRHKTVKQQRADAKKEGWLYDGRDLCQQCKNKEVKPKFFK